MMPTAASFPSVGVLVTLSGTRCRVESLLKRYANEIAGVLGCYDRVVIQGILPPVSYAKAMTSYLFAHDIRIFDYPRWAKQYADAIRANAQELARRNNVEIENVRRSRSFRKEDRIAEVLAKRGRHPGLVHILRADEACTTYRPRIDWTNNKKRYYLKYDRSKCTHFYFYFIDEQLGLCYLRVPTWCPFRLQFYFNGHNWLAAKLDRKGIKYEQLDNAFIKIEDFDKAQRLADEMNVSKLHAILDRYVRLCCPVARAFDARYRWSLMEVEYATDVVFRRRDALAPLYDELVRTAVHAVHAEHVSMFLGRKLDGRYRDEVGNDLSTRIEGKRIKHWMGPVGIKMYDKHGIVLRIETTANDVKFFKHHRKVKQRNGKTIYKLAPVLKSIYSLAPDLRGLLSAANRRYLEFVSELEEHSAGIKVLDAVSRTTVDAKGRSNRGFNFFLAQDEKLLQTLLRGEFLISGWRNRDLRRHLPELTATQVAYALRRLRAHRLIKRVRGTHKYYLTALGRRVALLGFKLKRLVVIPTLAQQLAA
jgi:hypothetical protein